MLLPIIEGGIGLGVDLRAIQAHMNAFPLPLMHAPVVPPHAIPLYPVPALGTGDLLLRIRSSISHVAPFVGGGPAGWFR